jgi:hypothetical protein
MAHQSALGAKFREFSMLAFRRCGADSMRWYRGVLRGQIHKLPRFRRPADRSVDEKFPRFSIESEQSRRSPGLAQMAMT